jgi:CelD/BcsL family acetyltransferase involved in cellulose biosynthesis
LTLAPEANGRVGRTKNHGSITDQWLRGTYQNVLIFTHRLTLSSVELLTRQDEIEGLMPEWTGLYERSAENLFLNPKWHQTWWNTIGHREGWQPHIVAGRSDGRLVAIASMAIRRLHGLRVLEWAGVDVFDYPDILTAAGVDATEFWSAIQRTGGFDVARIRFVRDDTSSASALAAPAWKTRDTEPAHAIALSYPCGERWLATLSKRKRSNHLASIRMIEKQGPLAMTVVRNCESVPGLVADLVGMKDAWAAKRGTINTLRQEGRPEFMAQLALQACKEGSLHLSLLTCSERVIAIHCGFVGRDGLYYYQPSYDQAFAKASAGRLHLTFLVMWAIDNDYHRFDFLRGKEAYKTDFADHVRWLNSYLMPHGLIGNCVARCFATRQRLGRRRYRRSDA